MKNQLKGVIEIYKYIFVKANADAVFLSKANHRELIEQYSKEGYRFVTAIPTSMSGHGKIYEFDLVFEKEE